MSGPGFSLGVWDKVERQDGKGVRWGGLRPYLLNCEVGGSRKSVSSLFEQRSGTAAEKSRIPAEIVLGDQEACAERWARPSEGRSKGSES